MVNCSAMTSSPNRAADLPPASHAAEPLELTPDLELSPVEQFDSGQWYEAQAEQRGEGGRQVLGGSLAVLSALWLAYTAWSAGRSLAAQPLSSPEFAQWIAVAAGPLALFGLVWLMFGRTRRKEAERFTRSVATMRAETQSLEALLEVLMQRLGESHRSLAGMTEQLIGLGDQATGRLEGITRELDASSARLTANGQSLDRAAENARNDIAVLLDDLPRAELVAGQLAEQLRAIGSDSAARASDLHEQIGRIAERSRETDVAIAQASQNLNLRLAEIEQAGAAAGERVGEAHGQFAGALDTLLDRTSATLDQIRAGIDAQSSAVLALVQQSQAGISRVGVDSAEALAINVDRASTTLDGLAGRVLEQEQASQRMIADINRGLAVIDQKFAELAAQGDQRAEHFLDSLSRARNALDGIAADAAAQDGAILGLADRTTILRNQIDQLSLEIRNGLSGAIGEAHGSAARLAETTQAMSPQISSMRDAAVEAGAKVAATGEQLSLQQERLGALLATLDDGLGDAQSKLIALTASITQTQAEAAALTAETGPALVSALVQVKDAAAHAAERAREAIEAVIPESAGKLSKHAREALEAAIQDSVVERLREVEGVAAQAIEAAHGASERLTQQMLSIGQSAAALEAHLEQTGKDQRQQDSEAFARRVSLLIDSMNSAAIDVGKILSDEVDDKAWESYLKGNRGVFTRRAVRLLDGGETRAIRTHYDSDLEFQQSVNRYVHDFEAMLRRVLAERDGGMIAVTLMSSDMGRLYAALGEAIDRRR